MLFYALSISNWIFFSKFRITKFFVKHKFLKDWWIKKLDRFKNRLQVKKAVTVTEEGEIGKGDQANAETLSDIECTSTKS